MLRTVLNRPSGSSSRRFGTVSNGVACLLAVLLCALVAGCGGGSGGVSSGVTEVVTPTSDKIVGYAVVPDLDAALSEISRLTLDVIPEGDRIDADYLRNELGEMLGDPNLESLDTQEPIVMAVLRGKGPLPLPVPVPPFALALPSKSTDGPYVDRLAGFGLQTRYEDGVLYAVQGDLDTLVPEVKSLYSKLTNANVKTTSRIYMNVERLFADHGAAIAGAAQMGAAALGGLAGMAGGAEMTDLLVAEIGAVLMVARQLREFQLDVGLRDLNLNYGMTVTSRSGTALAEFFRASSSEKASNNGLVAANAPVRGIYSLDGDALVTFYEAIVAEMKKDPVYAKAAESPVVQSILAVARAWSGSGAMAMGGGDAGPFGLEMAFASDLEAEALLKAMESYIDVLQAPLGAALVDREDPIPGVEIERAARRYRDIAVHRLDLPDMNPEEMLAAASMALPEQIEVAFHGGMVMIASDAKRLEGMLDAVVAGTLPKAPALAAQRKFGKGRHFYADYDIVEMLRQAFAAEELTRDWADEIESTGPMLIVGSIEADRADVRAEMPLDFLLSIRKLTEGR